jgi:hypothetical protein
MEYRNLKWNNPEHTSFNAELYHSEYGWIPYTVTEDDTGRGSFLWGMREGLDIEEFTVIQPTVEEIKQKIVNQVQQLLDTTAQQKNYDNGVSLASYANSTIDSFKQEALVFIEWRDTVWNTCYYYLDLFNKGEYEFTSVEDFIALLPTFTWENKDEISE